MYCSGSCMTNETLPNAAARCLSASALYFCRPIALSPTSRLSLSSLPHLDAHLLRLCTLFARHPRAPDTLPERFLFRPQLELPQSLLWRRHSCQPPWLTHPPDLWRPPPRLASLSRPPWRSHRPLCFGLWRRLLEPFLEMQPCRWPIGTEMRWRSTRRLVQVSFESSRFPLDRVAC